RALRQKLVVLVRQVVREALVVKQLKDPLVALVFENSNLVSHVLFKLLFFGALDGQRTFVLLGALSSKHLYIDYRAVDPRRAREAGIAHVARLLAKDRAKQFFFGGELSLAL